MKFLASFVLIALFSLAAGIYLPWWSIAIVAFVVALIIYQRPLPSFIAGFAAVSVLWSILSFGISSNNDHILAHKMSQVILKGDHPFLLVLITALIGALVAGFAALSGSFLRRAVFASTMLR